MSSFSRRWLATAVPLAFLLTGCNSGGSTAAPSGPAPVALSSSTTSVGDSGPAPNATSSKAAQGGGGGSSVTTCRAGQLAVTVRPFDSAMSQTHSHVLFRNNSHITCTLYGYPGVSFVRDDAGTQTGEPARPSGVGKKTVVTLKPGGIAHADLTKISTGAVPGCKPVTVRGFRVYPPDESAAVFVSSPQTACSAAGKPELTIDPVAAGAGN